MSIKICAGCKQGNTRIPAGVQFFGAIIKTRNLLQEKCFNRYFNIAFRGNAHILYWKKEKSRGKNDYRSKLFCMTRIILLSLSENWVQKILCHFLAFSLHAFLSGATQDDFFSLRRIFLRRTKLRSPSRKGGFPLQEKWISFVASFALSFPVYCFAPPLTSQPC